MLVRVLIAVLAVAGPMPVHICTCDAAHHATPLPTAPSPCGHHHDADEPAPGDTAVSDAHDCDCPTTTPQPAAAPAAVDAVYAAPSRLDAPALVRRALPIATAPSHCTLPLYLSLQTLRI